MRRALCLLALLLLPAAAAFAGDGTAMLGASGELYRVRSGVYGQLFANVPAGQSGDQVLALEITRDGATQRLLVPGTESPEVESSPALTVDRATNRVYLVWEGRQNYHSVLTLLSRSDDGWSEPFEFAADPFSFKSNPQLATTLDRYETIGADGTVVAASRTILHLVWWDDGGQGQRVLYSPLVVEDGDVLRANRIFDVQELSSGSAASGIAMAVVPALLQKPQVRGGRDRESVVISAVEPGTGRLATLELRSVTGELVSFGDKARASIIDTGARNPGVSRGQIVDKARASIIDTGRRLLRPAIADYLSEAFLASVRNSDPAESLEDAAEAARASIIDTGVSLRRGPADKALAQVVEIGRSEGTTNASHLLDVRRASRRDVPELPNQQALRVFLSQSGDDTAVAWVVGDSLRYRETTADGGWGPVHELALGAALSTDDAYRLVEQRVARK
ncbi:MAG TPA: hypothetical protein VGS57_09660 [Thermoanaerobaculia bacterium]|jgi:hypothetical protein|nr:hypothetical protein [Thermoanaerobaculia bacterium]